MKMNSLKNDQIDYQKRMYLYDSVFGHKYLINYIAQNLSFQDQCNFNIYRHNAIDVKNLICELHKDEKQNNILLECNGYFDIKELFYCGLIVFNKLTIKLLIKNHEMSTLYYLFTNPKKFCIIGNQEFDRIPYSEDICLDTINTLIKLLFKQMTNTLITASLGVYSEHEKFIKQLLNIYQLKFTDIYYSKYNKFNGFLLNYDCDKDYYNIDAIDVLHNLIDSYIKQNYKTLVNCPQKKSVNGVLFRWQKTVYSDFLMVYSGNSKDFCEKYRSYKYFANTHKALVKVISKYKQYIIANMPKDLINALRNIKVYFPNQYDRLKIYYDNKLNNIMDNEIHYDSFRHCYSLAKYYRN
jgi:hypothetical protein